MTLGQDVTIECDRCSKENSIQNESWFTSQCICINCSRWESEIIDALPKSALELENIGHVPEVDFDVEWGEYPEI
jgi:hypothetical protein